MTTLIDSASAPEEVGLRERKKQQTRSAIHEAAYRLIEAQGLETTTVEQICQDADVSTRTFFNYYPSKAAAALQFPGIGVDPAAEQRFRSARGGLVTALCDAIGSSAEIGPSHARIKQLLARRPEIMTAVSQMMMEVRGQFVAIASERASDIRRAELAVSLVMAALSIVMHNEGESDAPLADRLRETVELLVGVAGEQLDPSDNIA